MDDPWGEPSDRGFNFRIILSEPNAQERRMLLLSSFSSSPPPHWEGDREEDMAADALSTGLTPLDPTALSGFLSRFPEPNEVDDEEEDGDGGDHEENAIRVRDKSLAPPPKSGMVLPAPFPPPSQDRAEQPFDPSLLSEFGQEEQQPPPLTITRFTPTISFIDHALSSVSLTFSQPMVALSSVSNVESEAACLPISLTPEVEGKWRWIGTQTVQFDAKHRLPFSTAFTLSVAQGCKSSIGGILLSGFSHTFSTSPPRVIQWSPSSSPTSLSPLFLICFNQLISSPSILSHIHLSLDGDLNLGPKFSSDDFELVEETLAEKEWPNFITKEVAGNWVAFKLREKLLERFTSYVLCVPSGCPSAEGDLASLEDWSTSFSTYGPLVIESTDNHSSFYSNNTEKPCWELRFSNELDHLSVSKIAVHVSPSIQDFDVIHTIGSSSISLQPLPRPDTTYSVTLDASIKDIYGQHLDASKRTAEFKSGPVHPLEGSVLGPNNMIILNPSALADPFISLTVYNFSSLRIQLYQVDASDWSSPDLPSANMMQYAEGKNCVVGKQVHDHEVELQVQRDEPHEHHIPLSPFLQHEQEHVGQLLVIAEPTERAWMQCQGASSSYKFRDIVCAWVQCTNLSVDVFPDPVARSLTAWVSSLNTGAPVSQATVKVDSHKQDTDEKGLAVVPVDDGFQEKLIVVQKGNDITFMPNVKIYHNDSDSYGWYVFDSRGLYKPTEEVQIKGYVRKLESKRGGGQQPVFAHGRVNYTVDDARGNKLTMGDTPLNEYGSFFFKFSIPDNANLGHAVVYFEYEGEEKQQCTHQHTVNVQEFRKPEYEITSTHWPLTFHYSHPSKSDFVIASTSAMYYAGGPLTGAEARWSVQTCQTQYAPPGHLQYKFGSHDSPFRWGWTSISKNDSFVSYPSYELTGKTGMDGKHEVKIEYRGIEDSPSPVSISAHASIIDVNNQAQESVTTFLVHPSFYYVGFKLKEIFGRKGEEVKGEVIVCDVDGKLVSGVDVKLSISGQGKQKQEDDAGLLVYEDVNDEQDIAIRSDEKAVEFSFIPRLGGMYCMVFSAFDVEHRCNQSSCKNFFICGGHSGTQQEVEEFIPQDEAQLIPNKDMYEAGEMAVLLIQSPFWPAEGLIIMKCGNTHVGEKVRFCMWSNTHTISVLLDAAWIPTMDVEVQLVGSAPYASSKNAGGAKQPRRPAFAVGQSSIEISSSLHRLAVDISPKRAEESALPGGTVHVSVKVKEQKCGEAVCGAEISLVVVDEAILNLGGYTLSDPLPAFYPRQYCGTISHHLRKHCLLPDYHLKRRRQMNTLYRDGFSWRMADVCFMEHMCLFQAKCRSGPGVNANSITVRSNFDPLAAFIPSCTTDARGLAELTVKLPDNLTRYRIWAVAVTQTQFGLAESSLTVQLPVMVRPSPPRFLNLSDRAFISVVLQNQTKQSLALLVGMRTSNARVEVDSAGYSLTLPAFQRLAVSFPVCAVSVGMAHFLFVVSTSAEENVPPFSDASEVMVPIYTPVCSEFFATYGDVADKEVVLQPIKCPSHAFPGFGGLDVSISSTMLQSLTDALLYLYRYPFECNEQLASRIIGFLSLWEVLQAFDVKDMPSKEKMRSSLNNDLLILKGRQLSCGGWSWWAAQEGKTYAQPFVSLHVAFALVKASKEEVLEVDVEMFHKAMGYCADIESHISEHAWGRSWSQETKYALAAYALYIRALVGNEDVGEQASALLNRASFTHLTLEACGWMLGAFGLAEKKKKDDIKLLLDHVKSSVHETAEHASFTCSYEDDGTSVMLHSNHRTDAILLEALLITEPSSTLCAKLAQGLQAHRTAGRWSSTQENCFVLMALDRFFAVYEKEEPHFTANIWMGEQLVTSHAFSGRNIETRQARVPMSALLSEIKEDKEITTQLVLQKKGIGRLYYRIGLEYAPLNFQQKAASYGFTISRAYEGVDSPLHAMHDTTTGAWEFKLGEKIRVKLTLGTMVLRYHVAMVDAVPAGCEPLNRLALEGGSGNGLAMEKGCYYGRGWWVEHENMRDERVEAFCSKLRPGKYEYSYVMRATCKGEFAIPPVRVEEMYNPENFGRSASEKLVIQY